MAEEKTAAKPPAKPVPGAKPADAAKPSAEENERALAQDFKEYSVAEFFKKNRQMLGYSGKVRSLTTIVHEYVTNAIDSAEDAGVLPDILVEVHPISAKVQREQIASGDGILTRFDIPPHIADADILVVLADGTEQALKKDYDIKNEKRGRDTAKVVAFKSPPGKGSRIEYQWAYGHLKVIVQDNGMGIPRSKAAQAFGQLLSGTKFHQRRQKRGQQGIGACMRGDTLVPMADGRILPIKQIVEGNMAGEKVLALDMNSLKIVPAPIVKCVLVKNPRFVELKASKGKTIYLTPENPVLTVRGGKLEWIPADKIIPGEKIAAPSVLPTTPGDAPLVLDLLDEDVEVDEPALMSGLRQLLKKRVGGFDCLSRETGIKKDTLRNWFTRKMPSGNSRGRPKLSQLLFLVEKASLDKNSVKEHIRRVGHCGTFVNIPVRMNEEICWLAGLIAGDGHLTKEEDDKWGTGIGLANKDKRLIDLFCQKMKEVFGLNYSVIYNSKKDYYFAQTSSSLVGRLFEKLGLKRGRKFDSFELSESLLALPDAMLAAYLRGIFDAEGHVSRRIRSIQFLIYNPHAIGQISLSLLRFGVYSSVQKNRDQLRIMICGKQNLENFAKKIGFTSPEKNQLLYHLIDSIHGCYAPSEVVPNLSPILTRFRGFSRHPAVHEAILKGSASKYALKLLISQARERQVEVPIELEKHASSELLWLTVTSARTVPNPDLNVYDLEVGEHHNFVANGLIAHNSYATLFSQITTGKPIHIKTGIGNYKAYEADVTIDAKANKPAVSNEKEYSLNYRGVRVEAEFSEVTYNRSEYGVYEYLRRTALANPHVQITLLEPNNELIVFPRASKDIPQKPPMTLPHPLGITTGDLMDMAVASESRKISSFLQSDFTRISGDKAKELETLVNSGVKPGAAGYVDFNRSPASLGWPEAERIVQNIQKIKWIAPETTSLIPVGEVQLEKSLKNLLAPEAMKVVERKPHVFRGGIPFLVEAGIAYGGKSGAEGDSEHSRVGEILRFSNRVPLLFDSGSCAITEAVKTIDWTRYDLRKWDEMPVSIFVNFVSVYVPYTGAGKLSISQEGEIVTEIRQALMECAREIGIYLHSLSRIEDQEHRRQIFFRYIGEVAQALGELTGQDRKLLETKLRKIAEIRTTIAEKEDQAEEEDLAKMEEEAEKEIVEGG
ncbi:MAG: DNA topoisomerase VI subunit B [Candidatus Micrarchaeota archaeon]